MAATVTNIGEREALNTILSSVAISVGLYKHQISPDGNLSFNQITGLTVTGGYAPIELNNVLSPVRAADKWYVYTEASGKARGEYSNAPVGWTFTIENVNANEEAHGLYSWINLLNFNTGSSVIQAGDTVQGATSNATAVVTSVRLLSGAWNDSNAAGTLCVKSVTGNFQANENLLVGGNVKAKAVSDVNRELFVVDPFPQPKAIDTVGQIIEVTSRLLISTY